MFSYTLAQNLVELFTSSTNIYNTYILDDYNFINNDILENSKNIIYFKTSIICKSEVDQYIDKFSLSNKKKMHVLSIYLNPNIVKYMLDKYPNLIFYTIYNSNIFNEDSKSKILYEEQEEVGYSYNYNFMGSEYISKLFRKLIFNYFDDC